MIIFSMLTLKTHLIFCGLILIFTNIFKIFHETFCIVLKSRIQISLFLTFLTNISFIYLHKSSIFIIFKTFLVPGTWLFFESPVIYRIILFFFIFKQLIVFLFKPIISNPYSNREIQKDL